MRFIYVKTKIIHLKAMDITETKFCAQCLDDINHLSYATAFCKQCDGFICSEMCLKQHAKYRLTKSHCFILDDDFKAFIARNGVFTKNTDAESDEVRGGYEDKNKQQAILRTEFNIRTDSDKEICSIHASAVLKNGCVALADLKNSNIKLFSPEKRQIMSVLKLENGPRDICVSNINDDHLYVLESGVKGIYLVKADEMSIMSTIPTEGECFGITCWKNGIAVTTTSYKTYYGKYELHLLNYHGRVIRKLIPEKMKNLDLNLPWYLSSNLEGQNVLISDFGSHTVMCVDVDGGVLFVYNDTNLLRPVTIATDSNASIFVVGQRSHNIHHLSSKGEKKGVIYAEKVMEFPGGISFDKINTRFYVQCIGWSDTLQMFDLVS